MTFDSFKRFRLKFLTGGVYSTAFKPPERNVPCSAVSSVPLRRMPI